MVIKTFNIDEDVYQKYSDMCREYGVSMSKQINAFMRNQLEEPEVKPEYLAKLNKIRKGKFIKVDFKKRYGLE